MRYAVIQMVITYKPPNSRPNHDSRVCQRNRTVELNFLGTFPNSASDSCGIASLSSPVSTAYPQVTDGFDMLKALQNQMLARVFRGRVVNGSIKTTPCRFGAGLPYCSCQQTEGDHYDLEGLVGSSVPDRSGVLRRSRLGRNERSRVDCSPRL